MTALRKILNSSDLSAVLDLPPSFRNRKIEIIVFPVEEKKNPCFTMEQIEEWANAPDIQSLVGALKLSEFPADININGIRNERLSKKYII